MAQAIWIHPQDEAQEGAASELSAVVGELGVEVVRARRGDEACGVLLFSSSGSDLLSAVTELSCHGRERVIAVATGAGAAQITGSLAWPLRHAGAYDVLSGLDRTAAARAIVSRALRWSIVDQLMASPTVRAALVGSSTVWINTLREIVETAVFTDGSLLLIGESGTGKELIARMVHVLDRRANKKNLVVLDCTTVVPELAGSEFFGHERGAFTGASTLREGSFALAHGGTLFLDEVGELALPLQAQLLRVLQEHTYKRVGGNEWLHADFRLIAATNKLLDAEVVAGGFRRDLFHRIASGVYRIPSLRERTEDILPLAAHFLQQTCSDTRSSAFDPAVREYLVNRAYPGNVRELRQLVRRIAARHVGDGPVTIGALPPEEVPAAADGCGWKRADLERVICKALESGAGLQEIKEAASARAFDVALRMEDGSTRAAAQRLAVSERAVQMYRADSRRTGALARASDA